MKTVMQKVHHRNHQPALAASPGQAHADPVNTEHFNHY